MRVRRSDVVGLAIALSLAACAGTTSGPGPTDVTPADARRAPTDARRDAGANEDGRGPPADQLPGTRDPLRWPFASTSIWNMPLGEGAVYVPANIQPVTEWGMTIDPDLIVLRPDAPMTDVLYSSAGWDKTKDRCAAETRLMMRVPLPSDFLIPDARPSTPNHGIAVLMPDRRTIKQSQPFSRCAAGGPGTTGYNFPDVDLFGDGVTGAHGGSKLSAFGGTLRVGELRPGSGPIRHALKVNLYSKKNLWACTSPADCYRWPALRADSYAVGDYGGATPALKMGALLALPPSTSIDSLGLETEPARRIAWTLQNYGAYVVDNTAWDVYALVVEAGPDGDVSADFARDWGFPIQERSRNVPWSRDWNRLMKALHVVDNNGPGSVGGGGRPRQPVAPPIAP